MKSVFKGIIALTILFASGAYAGKQYQGGQLVTLPDELHIVNDLNYPVVIEGITYQPGTSAVIKNAQNQLNIIFIHNREGQNLGAIMYPTNVGGGDVMESYDIANYRLSRVIGAHPGFMASGYTPES